jgi:DnaK suppressor protein
MFVSLLQLMGFPSAKPVHSRAEENTTAVSVNPDQTIHVKKSGAKAPLLAIQEKPARRSPMKAQAVKPKAIAKKPIVAAKAVKVTKPVAKAKPVARTPAKAVSSAKAKAVKPVPAQKATPATKGKRPAVVAAPKKSAPVAKTAVKAATPVKPVKAAGTAKAAKVAAGKAVKAAKAAPVVVSNTKKKSESVSIQTTAPVERAAATKSAAKASTPEYHMTPSGVPVRSGRPSSRLAQLTVPSMAQAVASTAAKSSFTQITTVQPIVPPLASATKRNPKLANNWKSKAVDTLTDEEVIAMPDSEYMNDTQHAFFRLKLVTLKNDILNSAGKTTEHLREDTVVVPDPADRATIEEEHALELRTRDRERKLLKKIEQSITRIDAGDYGYCDETGEPIGVGRLLARPTATLSLEAQQRRELKQKMFGD